MSSKPILAAAVAGLSFSGCLLFAADSFAAAPQSGARLSAGAEQFVFQSLAQDAGAAPRMEPLPTQATDVDVQPPEPPRANVRLRAGRPATERHADARACLDKGDNLAIIKCAEKYRYR